MADAEIHKMDGRTGWEIDRADEAILQRVLANESRLCAIEKELFANGRPSLENRMRAYMDTAILDTRKYADDRDTHKSNSASQALMQALSIMQTDRETAREEAKRDRDRVDRLEVKQDERHEQNQARFSKLEIRLSMAVGAAAAVQVILPHIWPVR